MGQFFIGKTVTWKKEERKIIVDNVKVLCEGWD